MRMRGARQVAEMGAGSVADLLPQALVGQSRVESFGDKDGVRKRIDVIGRMLNESGFLRSRETEAQLDAQLQQQSF